MMRCLFTLVLIIYVVFTMHAQTGPDEKKIHGVFGHFFIGPSLIQSKKITDYLKQKEVLGNEYSPSAIGYAIGGEGVAMFERFYMGGGGFGIIKPVASSSFGRTSTTLSGGYLKLGYRYHTTPNTFMHVYSAFGWMGYTLILSNTSDSVPLEFNRKAYLSPGKEEMYSVGGFLFDIGTGVKTFVFGETDENDNAKGGLILGIDIGCLAAMPVTDWRSGNKIISGPPDLPAMLSPYIRISLGGGGFRYQ